MKRDMIRYLMGGLALTLALAAALAWVSTGFDGLTNIAGFTTAILISFGFGWLVFRLIRHENPPAWLVWLVLGAALLRLGLGVFWLLALPELGYPNETQQAGYIMYDAFLRDGEAWRLAMSGLPLLEAFRDYTAHDQYGGLLYFSALVYRWLGGSQHTPLLILVFTGTISALGIAIVWAFSRRLWGDNVAHWAAWGLALYPEAVLLGSSQMREAFTVTLAGLSTYLLYRWWQERRKIDLVLLFFVLLTALAISWAFTAVLVFLLLLFTCALIWQKLSLRQLDWRAYTGIALGGTFVVVAIGLFWRVLSKMSDFQGYLTETYSGIVQAIFSRSPEFLHMPFLVAYGIVQPLLPAALLGKGSSILWRGVGIWRAVGWTVVLALLLYATLLILRKRAWFSPAGMLLWGNWAMALVASYRAGGDLWDNPRYRAGFAAFQIALSAWALVQQKQENDPWLRRVFVVSGILVGWLLVWYLPRYAGAPWQIGKVLNNVGLGLLTSGLYLLYDWIREQSRVQNPS